MQQIRSTIADDLDQVNQLIISQLYSDVPLVEEIGQYIVAAGGKRMRPILVLLAAQALGYKGELDKQLAVVSSTVLLRVKPLS